MHLNRVLHSITVFRLKLTSRTKSLSDLAPLEALNSQVGNIILTGGPSSFTPAKAVIFDPCSSPLLAKI